MDTGVQLLAPFQKISNRLNLGGGKGGTKIIDKIRESRRKFPSGLCLYLQIALPELLFFEWNRYHVAVR